MKFSTTCLLALALAAVLPAGASAQSPSRAQVMARHANPPPPPPSSFTWTARQTEQAELMWRTLSRVEPATANIVLGNIARATLHGDREDRDNAWATLTWIAVNGSGPQRLAAIRLASLLRPEGARILSTIFTNDRFMTAQQRQESFDAIEAGVEASLPPRLRALPRAPSAMIVLPPLPQGVEFVGGRLVAQGAIGRANLDALVAAGRFQVGGNLNADGLRLGIEADGRLVLVGAEGRTTPIDVLGVNVAANGNAAILVRGRGTAGIFASSTNGIRAGVGGELFVGARAEAGATITIPLLIVDLQINPRGNVRFGAGVSGEASLSLRDENGWRVGGRLAGSVALGPGGGVDLGVWLVPGSLFRGGSVGPGLPPPDNTLMGPPRTQPVPRLPPPIRHPSIHAPGMGPRSQLSPGGFDGGRFEDTTAVAFDPAPQEAGTAQGAGMLRL